MLSGKGPFTQWYFSMKTWRDFFRIMRSKDDHLTLSCYGTPRSTSYSLNEPEDFDLDDATIDDLTNKKGILKREPTK